jgi:hypothetical protein
VKPTNKAEQTVAEPVEPRTETKGNADQQSTRRAQDRASVSQALERLWQSARQRKKERFASLLHHVDPAMLRTAFYAMKRDAAPGVDGMTWETYEQGLDRRIKTLHERVQGLGITAIPTARVIGRYASTPSSENTVSRVVMILRISIMISFPLSQNPPIAL